MSQFKNHYQYILIIKNTVKFHTPRKIGVFGTESCLLLLLFICKPGKKKKKKLHWRTSMTETSKCLRSLVD